MSINTLHRSMMPWDGDPSSDKLLNRLLIIGLILVLLLYIIIPRIDLPEAEVEEIPERFAELIVEEEPEVIPPPPVPEDKPKEEEKPVEEEEEPVEEEKPVEKEPEKPVEKPDQSVEEAREVAEEKFKESFKSLDSLKNLGMSLQNTSPLLITSDNAKRKTYAGSDLHADLTAGSGGIDTAAIAGNSGVSGDLGGRGKGKVGGKGKLKASGKGSGRSKQRTSSGGRSSEQIYLANQRVKGVLDRMYNKARRSNPSLQGTVTFKVKVNKSGKVLNVTVVKSSLGDPALESKLASRLKLMANYGPGPNETLQFNIVFTP